MLRMSNITPPLAGMIMEAGKGAPVSNLLRDTFRAVAAHFARARRKRHCAQLHRETKIEIAKLSVQIQHDIGWPARYENRKCVQEN